MVTSPQSLSFSQNAVNFDSSEEAYIANAAARGLFTPYEEALKVNRSYLGSWLNQIQAVVSGKKLDGGERLDWGIPCYLFILAIDPQVKKQEFSKKYSQLDEDERESFHCALVETMEPLISVELLRLCPIEAYQEALRFCFKYDDQFTPFEAKVLQLFEAVSNSSWPAQDKEQFLDRLFAAMPPNRAREFMFYCILQRTDLQACSNELRDRIKSLPAIAETILKEAEEHKVHFCLSLYEGNERRWVVQWFKENATAHPYADCIAVNFDASEWEGVQPAVAMQWILAASRRSSGQKEWAISSLYEKYAKLPLTSSDIQNFASILTPQALYFYSEEFDKGPFLANIIKYLVEKEPEKLLNWLKIILQNSNSAANEIVNLCKLVSQQNGLTTLFEQVLTMPPEYKARTFACLNQQVRKEFLSHLFQDRQSALQELSSWMVLMANHTLAPAVESDLYLRLHEIDRNAAAEIRSMLPDLKDYLDIVLPHDFDINDPVARQSTAIQKLKRHLLTPDLSYDDRKRFIREIHSDLIRDESANLVVHRLIDELPESTWPLLILHFSDEFRPDRKSWIKIAAKSLCYMVDNPYLGDASSALALDKLYQVHPKSISAILRRFMRIAPHDRFIETMNRLQNSCNFHAKGFKELIADCLRRARIDRQAALAHWLAGYYQRVPVEVLNRRVIWLNCFLEVGLQELFWEDGFTKDTEERAQITKFLVDEMGSKFLRLFLRDYPSQRTMIESLQKTDPEYSKTLLYNEISLLCRVRMSPVAKVRILQNFCEAYGEEHRALVLSDRFPLSDIQKWYEAAVLIKPNSLDLKFVHLINPEILSLCVTKQLEMIAAESHVWLYGLVEVVPMA